MGQFKIKISHSGCGIKVYEQEDYQTESPEDLFVSYSPSTGIVVFNAIEDDNLYGYFAVVSCPGNPDAITPFSLGCTAPTPAGPPTPISPTTPVSSCVPNYSLGWNYGSQAGGTASCNDSLDCNYFNNHIGTTRLVSINNLAIGGRVLKDDCSPFTPSDDASFRPSGCNVFIVKRADLQVTYAVVVLDSNGYIVDINSNC